MDDSLVIQLRNFRNEKQLDEAIALVETIDVARASFKLRGTVAWVYYDQVKLAIANQDYDLGKEYIQLFHELALPNNDFNAMVYGRFEQLAKQCENTTLQEVESLGKAGKPAQAWQLAWNQKELYAEQNYIPMAWLLFNTLKMAHSAIKELSDNQKAVIVKILHQYASLDIPKPNMVHSNIFNALLKVLDGLPDFDFINWYNQFGLNSLAQEDFSERVWKEKNLPSLISKIARAYGKCLMEKMPTEKDLEIYEEMVAKEGNSVWPTYYLAKIYNKMGNSSKAINSLRAVIKQKPQEPWVWALAANIVEEHQPAEAINYQVKALSLNPMEGYDLKLQFQLGEMLLRHNETAWGKYEISALSGEKLSYAMRQAQLACMLNDTDMLTKDAAMARRRDAATKAMISIDDSNVASLAILCGSFENKAKKIMGKIILLGEKENKECVLATKLYKPLRNASMGSLLNVVVNQDGYVIDASLALDASIDSYLKTAGGIVTYIDKKANFAQCTIGIRQTIKVTNLPAKLGDYSQFSYIPYKGKYGSENFVVNSSQGFIRKEELDYYKEVKGKLKKLSSGHGKLDNQVFVFAKDMQRFEPYHADQEYAIAAISSFDKKWNKDSWTFLKRLS